MPRPTLTQQSWLRCRPGVQRLHGLVPAVGTYRSEYRIPMRPDRATAEPYRAKTVQRYAPIASRLADWLEWKIPQGLTVFNFPAAHLRRTRTTSRLERISRVIRRRTRVVSIFPNEAACLRLISAILMEIDEEWQTGKAFLTLEEQKTSRWLSP